MGVWKIIAVGSAAFCIYIWRRYCGGKFCTSMRSLKGKTVIVTGANCGVGKATACELAKREARVILACRDPGKGNGAVKDIRRQTDMGQLIVKTLDLASFESIRSFASEILQEEDRIDILVNNAGVFTGLGQLTKDGFEIHMGVNHLGHFLLTNLLLDMIKESAPSRIVIVSSLLMKRGKIDFSDFNKEKLMKSGNKSRGYADSKLANAMFCKELAKKLDHTGVSALCVSPGFVLTSLGRDTPRLVYYLLWPLARLLIKSPYQGCQSILHCCVSEDLDKKSGVFIRNCTEQPWDNVVDDATASKLWELSERLTSPK